MASEIIDEARDVLRRRHYSIHTERTVVLPETVRPLLADHIERVVALHDQDLRAGFGAVYIPAGLILLATQHLQDQLINREGTQRTQKESE